MRNLKPGTKPSHRITPSESQRRYRAKKGLVSIDVSSTTRDQIEQIRRLSGLTTDQVLAEALGISSDRYRPPVGVSQAPSAPDPTPEQVKETLILVQQVLENGRIRVENLSPGEPIKRARRGKRENNRGLTHTTRTVRPPRPRPEWAWGQI